jgi:hypothetical protein
LLFYDSTVRDLTPKGDFLLDFYEHMLTILPGSKKNAEAQMLSQSGWRTGLQDIYAGWNAGIVAGRGCFVH